MIFFKFFKFIKKNDIGSIINIKKKKNDILILIYLDVLQLLILYIKKKY